MGVVEKSPDEKRFWLFLFLAGLIAGLVLRFYLASFAQMPGHGDSAFYYTVAKNIASGRGPVIDYIVYFFSGLLPLPHYAGDFWNPSASFLIAIPMILFGRTISSALPRADCSRYCSSGCRLFGKQIFFRLDKDRRVDRNSDVLLTVPGLVFNHNGSHHFCGCVRGSLDLFHDEGTQRTTLFFFSGHFYRLSQSDSTGRYSFVSYGGNMHLVSIYNLEK